MADCVRVAVRVRPLSAKEELSGCRSCVRFLAPPNDNQLVVGRDRAFTFDQVFSHTAAQSKVFDVCVSSLLDATLDGYNATIFAYGQTGSGKTFTMGTDGSSFISSDTVSALTPDSIESGSVSVQFDKQKMGIAPRVIEDLFSRIGKLSKSRDLPGGTVEARKFSVRVSYLEIYNEEIRDLLHPSTPSKNIAIREDSHGGIIVAGVQEETVETADELIQCLIRGSLCRTTGSTLMNEASSRSHSIFTIITDQKVIRKNVQSPNRVPLPTSPAAFQEDEFFSSKFHLVDLAGSERNKRTGAQGARFKESVTINSGLLALGNVISALGDEKRRIQPNFYVPYRDSKLTRLLQDSLGGNSKTWMLACVSPADSSFDETLNTLKYANRARNIQNQPIRNVDPQAAELKALRDEILSLQQQIHTGSKPNISTLADMSFSSVEDLISSHNVLCKKCDRLSEIVNAFPHKSEHYKRADAKHGPLFHLVSFVSSVLDAKTQAEVSSIRIPDFISAVQFSTDSLRGSAESTKDNEELMYNMQQELINLKLKNDKNHATIRQLEDDLFESQNKCVSLHADLTEARSDLLRDEEIFSEKMEEMKVLWKQIEDLQLQLRRGNDSEVFSEVAKPAPYGSASSRPDSAIGQATFSPKMAKIMETNRAAESLEDADAVLVRSPEQKSFVDDSIMSAAQPSEDELHKELGRLRDENADAKRKLTALRRESDQVRKQLRNVETESSRQLSILHRKLETKERELSALQFRLERRVQPSSIQKKSGPANHGRKEEADILADISAIREAEDDTFDEEMMAMLRKETPRRPKTAGASTSASDANTPKPQRRLVFSPSAKDEKARGWRPSTAPSSGASISSSSVAQVEPDLNAMILQKEALEKLEVELKEREKIVQERESAMKRKSTLEEVRTPRNDKPLLKLDAAGEMTTQQSIVALDDQISDLEREMTYAGRSPSKSSTLQDLAIQTAAAAASELENLKDRREALSVNLRRENRVDTEYSEVCDRIDILEAQLKFKDDSIAQLRSSISVAAKTVSASVALPSLWSFIGEEPAKNVETSDHSENVLKRYFDAMVNLKVDLRKQERVRMQLELEISEKNSALDNLQRSILVLEKEFDRRLDKQANDFRVQQGLWQIERERFEQERRELEKQVAGVQKRSRSATPSPFTTPSSKDMSADSPPEALHSALRQKEEQLQILDKDNYYYRQTNRELKRKLREVLGALDKEKKQWLKDRQSLLAEIENLKEFLCQDSAPNSARQVVRRSVSDLRPLSAAEIAERKAQASQSPGIAQPATATPIRSPSTGKRVRT
eukprot:ANDGO_02988.mRNA.1 Kinesin-like protein KIN-4A